MAYNIIKDYTAQNIKFLHFFVFGDCSLHWPEELHMNMVTAKHFMKNITEYSQEHPEDFTLNSNCSRTAAIIVKESLSDGIVEFINCNYK